MQVCPTARQTIFFVCPTRCFPINSYRKLTFYPLWVIVCGLLACEKKHCMNKVFFLNALATKYNIDEKYSFVVSDGHEQ